MVKTVTIYSTPTCGYCTAAKQFMQEHKVEYTDINVALDQAKAKEMIDKSGQMGVPVIVIAEGENEEVIIGFDQNRLATALGI